MEINSTIQSYEDISSLEMFEENKERRIQTWGATVSKALW